MMLKVLLLFVLLIAGIVVGPMIGRDRRRSDDSRSSGLRADPDG